MPYVPLTEQLVTEILVSDMKRSVRFYLDLGFTLLRDGGDFVELTWEADRYYGLRDFIVADPDGFGIRFASALEAR